MRIVGRTNHAAIELDPAEAYRRGTVLDRMLRSTAPPFTCGVLRGTHEYFARLDRARQLAAARKLNPS
jgi:hypothetical protein